MKNDREQEGSEEYDILVHWMGGGAVILLTAGIVLGVLLGWLIWR